MSGRLERWLCSKLGEYFKAKSHDFEDTARYILTFETSKDVEEYLVDLLGETQKARALVSDFLVTWKPPVRKVDPIPSQLSTELYVKPKLQDVTYMQGKTQKRTEEKVESEPSLKGVHDSSTRSHKHSDRVGIPHQSADGRVTKKRSKFVPVNSPEDVARDSVRLPGRHLCDCQAQQHPLVNNCISCGRVVCEQEGAGLCTFCGVLVCSPADQELINSNSNRGKKLLEKLTAARRHAAASADRGINTKEMSHDDKGSLDKALRHRDKLLDFDRTSEKRTRVIDDEMDYFASDTNQWLSREERQTLKAREEELRKIRHGSRRNKVITLDFAGRRVVDEQEKAGYEMYDPKHAGSGHAKKQPTDSIRTVKSKGEDSAISSDGLVNPTITMPRPTFQLAGVRKKTEKTTQLGEVYQKDTLGKVRLRIQDKELQEMRDEGMCLSMHQPWASLLVAGIKGHEGRSWYTAHRGRLWIAAAAKVPEQHDIYQIQENYIAYYQDENIEFPDSYPTSCLLGCVDVIDCLSLEQYQEQFPHGESSSPYVLVCENPKQLVVKFPVRGKHKIWHLEKHVHGAAKKGLRWR